MKKLIDKIVDLYYDIIDGYRRKKNRLKHEIENLKDWYIFEHKNAGIYYYYSSTDCDLCTNEGYNRVRTKKAYERVKKDLWECAEGATHISICLKSEYLEYYQEGGYTTDHIMRAYENGDGRKVIL